jgi:hypothetical protein
MMKMTIGLIGGYPLSMALGRLKKLSPQAWRRAVFIEDRISVRGRDTLAGDEA